MPKMKTKSGAKKRFRVRPGGTVKRGQAYKRHILTKKSTTRKRQHLDASAQKRRRADKSIGGSGGACSSTHSKEQQCPR